MQVVILCGGQGTRAYPHTQKVPKALMEIGGVPIVEHVMRIYAAQGYTRFILSCGYLKEAIVDYVAGHRAGWDIRCIDTGADADTGDRILRLREFLEPAFLATYCDGLGPIDLRALRDYHTQHGGLCTVTGVVLRSQYGLIDAADNGQVSGFREKPFVPGSWINGGFFAFDRRAFDFWEGHNLERDVLPSLARRGALYMYKHHDFWRSMDTYKDQQELNALWSPYVERFSPAESANAAAMLSN